jgi:hypothetical protein
MKRILALLPATLVVVFVLAGPSIAKPWHEEPIEATVTVEGSGLRPPIVLGRGGGGDDCGILYPCNTLGELEDPFVQLAMYTGISSMTPMRSASSGEVPPASSRGPAYQVTYRVTMGDREEVVRQVLYPSAAGRPWVHTPEGQSLFDRDLAEAWLPGSVSLTNLLRDLGFPKDSPVVAPVSSTPQPAPVAVSPWLMASILLGLLVAAAVVLGRNRRAPALGG